MNGTEILKAHKRYLRDERLKSRAAAKLFAEAVEAGNGQDLHDAALALDETMEGWAMAMRAVAKLPQASDEVRSAFSVVWVVSKYLSFTIGNRGLLGGRAAGSYALRLRWTADAPLSRHNGDRAEASRLRLFLDDGSERGR